MVKDNEGLEPLSPEVRAELRRHIPREEIEEIVDAVLREARSDDNPPTPDTQTDSS